MAEPKFSKTLAKYYHRWLRDCKDSAIYCNARGDVKRAAEYLANAESYSKIIEANQDAIEFFSNDNNAFKIDSALPVRFRGYK